MKKINLRDIEPAIYKRRMSGLVVTWDIRIKSPNGNDYITPDQMHTIEHSLDMYLRKECGNYRIVGVYPNGSQTGFSVLTRFIDSYEIHELICDYIMDFFTTLSIPGVDKSTCSQYLLHDLRGAKEVMREYYANHLRYYDSAIKYKR